MDFCKTFDKIPERFDKYRPRYCKELFQELEMACELNFGKKVLEIGPGTGQAAEPILKTGCDYTAIELGENFTALMEDKFGCYQNFHIVNADEYICYISTHCDHITLEKPYKSNFYAGIRKAIMEAGNEIIITDTIPLYLV